jgi:hypothetical protein
VWRVVRKLDGGVTRDDDWMMPEEDGMLLSGHNYSKELRNSDPGRSRGVELMLHHHQVLQGFGGTWVHIQLENGSEVL